MQRSRLVGFSAMAVVAFLSPGSLAPAADTARVCNESTTPMAVALAYRAGNPSRWASRGWWWVDSGDCVDSIALDANVAELYAWATSENGDLEWRGSKALCVSLGANFDDRDAEGGTCSERRAFRRFPQDAKGVLAVTLRDADAVRVAYDFALCNRTGGAVSVAIGNAAENGSGLFSDGWYGIEAGACERFFRLGKLDHAYFFAQSPARQLVWRGDVPLCTRYHEGFVLEKADSIACKDGDSERLPFIKWPLAKGRGSHDLVAADARSFRFGLNLCNGYREDIHAAVAHLDGIWMNGNVTRGFWRLRPGECRLVDAVAVSPVYVYAETDSIDKAWSGKDLTACVRDEPFTFTGADRSDCKGAGERRVGFVSWGVSEGANVYKFE